MSDQFGHIPSEIEGLREVIRALRVRLAELEGAVGAAVGFLEQIRSPPGGNALQARQILLEAINPERKASP